MVFSNSELAEFEAVMEMEQKNVMQGKKPSLSSVLMGLQFASVVPDNRGKMWFQDNRTIFLMVTSVRKLMDDNPPEMFSVAEKAFMFSILNMGNLLIACEEKGFGVESCPEGQEFPNEEPDWDEGADES